MSFNEMSLTIYLISIIPRGWSVSSELGTRDRLSINAAEIPSVGVENRVEV